MHQESHEDRLYMARSIEAFIRIALLALLLAWCFEIMRPFIIPLVWGVIIAIGLSPLYQRLVQALRGRGAAAAVILSLASFVVLLVPAVLLGGSLVEGAQQLTVSFEQGTLKIPPPPSFVAELPVVGATVHDFWTEASSNLEAALAQAAPHLKAMLTWLVGAVAGAGIGVLHFVFAIGIAGVLLAKGTAGQRAVNAFARRLSGARGVEFAELAEATIRSVTRGILGVALIQSVLAGLGWLVVGVPAAGLWALLALLLSTVQIGILPLTIPILIYVFSTTDTLTFLVFLAWSLFVGTIDNLLKPILLGRGVEVPMAVIFIGAIGGFLSSGIIGLFVGAVVLVLGYKLFIAWLHQEPTESDTLGGGGSVTP